MWSNLQVFLVSPNTDTFTLKHGDLLWLSHVSIWKLICRLPLRLNGKNPPAYAGDTGSIPVQENPTNRGATKPLQHNYWACAPEPESCNYWAHVPQLPKHRQPRARAPQQEKPSSEKSTRQQRTAPQVLQLEKTRTATKTQHSQI